MVKCQNDKLTNYFHFDLKKGLRFNHNFISYLCNQH